MDVKEGIYIIYQDWQVSVLITLFCSLQQFGDVIIPLRWSLTTWDNSHKDGPH